jgi:superfamily I DNA/RNA helicase
MKLPQFEELTEEQQKAVDTENSFAVYGGAGTGKTMVSIWRHIRNFENRKKSYLLTFTHTLTYFLEILTSQESIEAKEFINNAHAFLKNLESVPEIDELIIDEAQDISLAMHETFYMNFPKVSYGADDKQHLYQNATNQKILEEIYKPQFRQELSLNFRNSYQILNFTKALFPDFGITEKMVEHSKKTYISAGLPKLKIAKESKIEFCELLEILSTKESIAILVPTLKIMEEYRELLEDCKVEFSSYNYKDYGSVRHIGISRTHLTTFHSSKGLEFDNVIIPEFQLFSKNSKYYVGFTRAKTGLFLISDGENPISEIDKNLYELEL